MRPFENRGDSADEYLGAVLADELAGALGASGAVRLLSARPRSRTADYAVSAGIRRSGELIRVSTRLERPATGEIIWSSATSYQRGRTAAVVEQLARDILGRIGAGSPRRLPVSRVMTRDPIAEDSYRRGQFYLGRYTEADIAKAVFHYREALARDSAFAAAWAGLALAMVQASIWGLQIPDVPPDSIMPRQLDAAQRALLLDSTSAEIWIARGQVGQRVDPTGTAAVGAMSRAVALDSLSVRGWAGLAMALQESGDAAGAQRAIRRAIAIDPGDARSLEFLGLFHYWARQYDSARVWADSAVTADPTFMGSRRLSGTVALAQGRAADAETQFVAARTVGPGPERIWAIAGLVVAAAARHDTVEARALAAEAEALSDQRRPPRHSAIFLAWIWAALGDRDRALAWLERYRPAADRHFQQHLLGDAPLDALRDEPRFRALLR